MNTIKRKQNFKLGHHIECNLIYEKGCCKVQPTIKLCDVGIKNGLNLSLGITKSNISSPLNFGLYFKPTFLKEFVESSNKISVVDIFDNESNFYFENSTDSIYYNYQSNNKLVKENATSTYTYLNDNDQSLTYSLTGSNLITSKFRGNPKFALSSTGIFSVSSLDSLLTSAKANFIKDSTGKITQIEVFPVKSNLVGENKKDIIEISYDSGAISQIKFIYSNGTEDIYHFLFYPNQWVLSHEQTSMKLEFNFDSSNNVISYKEDYIDANRGDFINTITCNETHTIISYPNNKFTYIHFDDNGNSDYDFDDKGITSFLGFTSYRDDYLLERKSNRFIFGKNTSKYVNIAPLSVSTLLSNWAFTKGNNNSKFTALLNLDIPYFNVFNTNAANVVTVDSSDSGAKLTTEIERNFSNKKFMLSFLYNVKSSGSAANFTLKITPYSNDSVVSGTISRNISTSKLNDFRYVCEEVYFTKTVDKIIIEIGFKAGQKIEFYDLRFIEHPYGEIYFRDSNHLIYKTIKNYEVIRIKNYDFQIRNLEFDKINLFIEKDKFNDGSTSTVYLNQYVKKVSSFDLEGNTYKEETIYKKGSNEEVLQKTSTYDSSNLLLSDTKYNQITSHYTYYLNTDLLADVTSFDTKTIFGYTNKQVNTSLVSKNNQTNILYSTNQSFNLDGLTSSLSEINKTPYGFSYNFMKNLTNCSIGNTVVEANTYVDSDANPTENLESKTVNGQTFDFTYDNEDRIIEIENTTTNSVFGFEYDDLNNLSKITNSDSSVEQFSYDGDNNLIENSYKEHKIKNIYQNNTNVMKSYDFNNENYRNIISTSNENVNSEIVNSILAKLADTSNYVCLFDRTINYNKSSNSFANNVTRFCSLIRSYYNSSHEIPVEYVGQGNMQPQRISSGLTHCILSNHRYLKYTKSNVSRLGGAFRGSVGSLYAILNMDNFINIASISFNNLYAINLVANYTNGLTLKIQIENLQNSTIMQEFDTGFVPRTNYVGFYNISYIVENGIQKIKLYTEQGNKEFIFNLSLNLASTASISYSFNRLKNASDVNCQMQITAILANFDTNISLSEVINHFNLAYRAHLLSGTLEDKNYYISNSTSNFNYSKLNPNITLLTFKNTLTDNKNNSPLEYIADEKVFGYGGDNLGNCYYVYGMPLLYQTNLNTNGRICFKSKIISSITEDQYYFTLYNSNITIKLIFTMGGQLKIDVNGVSKSVMSGMDFFKKAHCIDLNYILTNGRLNYTFNLGNNNIVNGYIDFTSLNSMDTSDFKLLIGANKQKVSITDVDNTTHKKWKNLFNGFISDFMYYSTNSVSVPTLEFEELKSPVISYSSFDVFDRKNQIKTNYKNKNVISKKLDYLKDDKYITPLLSEEKILINSSLDDFNSNLNRKFLYSYEGNYENAPKYKNIYSYEENIEVNGNNSSQVYKRDYEYTEGSNFIKKEIIRKGSIVNGDFIENYRLILDYSYNANNCLSSVKQTLNDGSTITNIFNYSANFPHLLTYHNSNQLVYDGLYLKQIKNYMGQAIKEFGYRGTKLTSYKEPLINKTIIFEYDAQGRRTKKFNQSANDLVEYYYDDKLLIKEKHSNYSLNFLYNESNELIGFDYSTSNNSTNIKYFYLRNSFNDIVELIDENGNSIVHYLYDAFGNVVETIDNSSNSLSTINPFRYRGYYFDVETQLYYCNSRYYSPELCRWISPDSIEYLDPQSVNGLNLYCYCHNNPILYVDPSGHMPEWAMWFVGSMFLIGSILLTIASGGAAAGTVLATVHTISTGAMIGGITSAIIGMFAGGITYENGVASWDWSRAAEGFMWGSITGIIGGAAGSASSNVGSKLSTYGKLGKIGYIGIQGLLNSSIAGVLTIGQGLITGDFSWIKVGISAFFGLAGGIIGVSNWGKGIKNIIIGTGLELGESIIVEIIEWWQSRQQTNIAYLRLVY